MSGQFPANPLGGKNRVSLPTELLWALIGLLLTIGGTWMEAFITNPPWDWGNVGLHAQSLGVSFQVGAVLLTGCLGGKNAAALSQIAYLALGLLWFDTFNLQVFTQGAGPSYIQQPSFGYLLGFVPAAWVCGFLAFQTKPKLETLAWGCLCGLAVIHVVGLTYLTLGSLTNLASLGSLSYSDAVMAYSILRLPGQLVLVCLVSLVAYLTRQILFY
jgi:biotin transport system substrate-specific component